MPKTTGDGSIQGPAFIAIVHSSPAAAHINRFSRVGGVMRCGV